MQDIKYIYSIHNNMITRCYNKNTWSYKNYGGRGIAVFDGWLKNKRAFADYIINNLGHRKAGQSLDRINNNGNYEPNNLRWATSKEQFLNSNGLPDRHNNKTNHKMVSEKKKIYTFYLNDKDAKDLKSIQSDNLRDRSAQIAYWIRLQTKANKG